MPNHRAFWQNIPNVCHLLVQICMLNVSVEAPSAGQRPHTIMGQQPPPAAHFSSETAMAKKLNIRKFCSKNFRKCCQKCHPHAPALVLHTVPLLALHPLIPGRAHRPYLKTQIQAERKLCVAKSFSYFPLNPKHSCEMNEDNSNFALHVALDHHS